MSGFLKCFVYLMLSGFAVFLLGRALPKSWFRYDAFPFRDYSFEQHGNLYRRFGIHKWQNRVPDMSRFFSRWMPPKRLSPGISSAQVEVMVQETCIAECAHLILWFSGAAVLWIWPGLGGAAMYLLGSLIGNLPFIFIQRFNRPKLVALMKKLRQSGR